MNRRRTRKSSIGSRPAGSGRRRRWPLSWRSSPPTRRATFPDPPTPSMAEGRPPSSPRHSGARVSANPESRTSGFDAAHRSGMTNPKRFSMPVVLDPDAAAVFAAFQAANRPPYESVSPTVAREFYLAGRPVSNPEPPELESAKPLSIPAPHGPIPARIYTPKQLRKTNGLAPCLVFFHGGGWVIGDLDSHDVVCRKLADEGQLIVVSVDYRRAPEHKFPAAVEDAIAATTWIAGNSKSLGIDQSRLMVGGDSAGGNLAAVVAIAARDGDGPAIAAQVLIYPAIDFALTHPSHQEPETSILLTHSVIRWFRDHYLNSAADVDDWRASPVRTKTLIGLPPAYVLTAGADPLRDEGDEYAHRLKQAGVPVATKHYPGQFHGFFTMGKLLQQANIAAGEIGVWLRALG